MFLFITQFELVKVPEEPCMIRRNWMSGMRDYFGGGNFRQLV